MKKQLKKEREEKRKAEKGEKVKAKIEHKQNLKQQLEHERKLKKKSEPEQNSESVNELDQGVWTDPKTGLMWMRCSMGQMWDGVTAQGDAKTYTWDKARQAVEQMNKKGGFAGHTDWRLPDLETLKALMIKNEAGYNCPQDVLLPPKAGFFGPYWSSSPSAHANDHAWGVNFGYGNTYNGYKNYGVHVRAVRTGQ